MWNRHARSERPVGADGAYFFGRDDREFFHQLRVPRAAQADILGRQRCADDVVIPVYRINAVEQRNSRLRLQRAGLVPVAEFGPRHQIVARLRVGIATAQQRAEVILLDIVDALEEHLIGLRHLPDLLLQRHLRQQRLHLLVEVRELSLGLRRGRRGLLKEAPATVSAASDWARKSRRVLDESDIDIEATVYDVGSPDRLERTYYSRFGSS